MKARIIFDSADNVTTMELTPQNDGERQILTALEGKTLTMKVEATGSGAYRKVTSVSFTTANVPEVDE